MPYPSDSEGLKGLARVTFRNSVPYEGTGETAPAPGEDLPPLPPYRQWEAAHPVEAEAIRARERRGREAHLVEEQMPHCRPRPSVLRKLLARLTT